MEKTDTNRAPNYVQEIVYALFIKSCPTIADVERFSKEKGINFNTLRDFYYKRGKAGISTINDILCEVLTLDDAKVQAITEMISQIEPMSECDRVWNSIDLPANEKLYYAQVAKAVYDLDKEILD